MNDNEVHSFDLANRKTPTVEFNIFYCLVLVQNWTRENSTLNRKCSRFFTHIAIPYRRSISPSVKISVT